MSAGEPLAATVRRRIEWADTDASGHYHYATALRLFEAAESDLLDELGLLREVYGQLPRAHVTFDYRRVLWFRDMVEASVSVTEVGRTSITYSFEVLRDGELCVRGRVVAVLVDDAGEPTPWPDGHRRLLDPAAQLLDGYSPCSVAVSTRPPPRSRCSQR